MDAAQIVDSCFRGVSDSRAILGEGFGIPGYDMQSKTELIQFVKRILEIIPESDRNSALEIGLYHGWTHRIWRSLFAHVLSVEKSWDCADLVADFFHDEKSKIVCGDSQLPSTVELVSKNAVLPVDFLFIDGGHLEEEVRNDFDNYLPMVRTGGIVAFHDTADIDSEGVTSFLRKLNWPMEQIHLDVNRWGISFFIV